jgi:predicted HicB family RNase H-like nuclease
MLTYKGYVGKVEFDEEAEVFYGTVINTRDKITFQAECAKDLRKEFEQSVETYLEFCQELGEEPERPYSGKFVLRLPPEAHKKVSLAAQAANKSLNAWIADHIIESANRELSF